MAYDSRAIKLPKQVKRSAAAYTDPHQRGAFIRSFVRMIENESKFRVISAWCLDKGEWRAFKVANVMNVRVVAND